jgi:hypothetical protein
MRYRANAQVVDGKRVLGRVSYIVKAKNRAEAKRKVTRMMKARKPKRVKKNVEQGFWDSKGFHPIRASADYAPYKAGEFPRRGKSSAERKRASASAKRRRRERIPF